jgi:CBS domain-containing protein
MVLVHHVLEEARRRLAVLPLEASIVDAARILARADTPLVIVCDDDGCAVGVVSKTDLVSFFTRSTEHGLDERAGDIMSRSVLSCHVTQTLQFVWGQMSARRVRCVPVLDNMRKPLGVLSARDLAGALFDEVTNEEVLLRDYVLGIGYQ